MAQTVQLLGTIVHQPRLIVLDEPFSGLDAINQGRLEELIRERGARPASTIIFSTHVIAHAERLCERIAIIAEGKVAFEGRVDEARDRLRPIVRLRTRAERRAVALGAFPASARREGGEWVFELPEGGPEPLLKALIDGGAGIETLAIERPGLHDAFVAIAGDAAARRWATGEAGNDALDPRGLRHRPPRFRRDGPVEDLPLLPARAVFPLLLGGVFGGIGAQRRERRPSGRWSR